MSQVPFYARLFFWNQVIDYEIDLTPLTDTSFAFSQYSSRLLTILASSKDSHVKVNKGV